MLCSFRKLKAHLHLGQEQERILTAVQQNDDGPEQLVKDAGKNIMKRQSWIILPIPGPQEEMRKGQPDRLPEKSREEQPVALPTYTCALRYGM